MTSSATNEIKDKVNDFLTQDIKEVQLAINKSLSLMDSDSAVLLVHYLDLLKENLGDILKKEGDDFTNAIKEFFDKQYKFHEELSGSNVTRDKQDVLFSDKANHVRQHAQEKAAEIRKMRDHILPKL